MYFQKICSINRSVLMLLFLKQIQCWHSYTHTIIAKIAFDKLQIEAPNVLKHANNLLYELEKSQRNITEQENMYPFVECTNMADIMKDKGWSWQKDWHYMNKPFFEEEDQNDRSLQQNYQLHSQNISFILSELKNWLKLTPSYRNSFIYKTIRKHYDDIEGRSIALRLLIHYIGDIHQPLHSLTRVSNEFPEGDRGGNNFPLEQYKGIKELHALWDSVIYNKTQSINLLPFTHESWDDFGKEVQELVEKYKKVITKEEKDKQSFDEFAEESFLVGTQTVYQNIKMNEKVAESYKKINLPIAERRIVLAGLRLADVMKEIFPNTDVVEIQNVRKRREKLFLQ